jgi:hypothetical protein
LSPARNAIAEILIDAVDEGGYLRLDLAELAERLGCEPRPDRERPDYACRASSPSASSPATSASAWRCS